MPNHTLLRRVSSIGLPIALLTSCADLARFAPSQTAPTSAQTTQSSGSIAPALDSELDYRDYENVLRTYVNAGLVDYPALQANSQALKRFIQQLGAVSPEVYADWTEAEKIAFLINAYNAITLESIIDQTPLKNSIKDIFGVWNFKKHQVMGQALTLDQIEHEILRRQFQEPRIHAALVCAALSCPPLRSEPYTGENLEAQLEDQVRQWLSSPQGLQIDRSNNQVAISAIFKWFGEDWEAQYASQQFVGNAKERAVLNFISRYMSPDDRAYLEQGDFKLNYLNYDWSLNQQQN